MANKHQSTRFVRISEKNHRALKRLARGQRPPTSITWLANEAISVWRQHYDPGQKPCRGLLSVREQELMKDEA